MEKRKLGNIPKAVISIVSCLAAGGIGSVFTTPAIPTWYASLQKPPFTPPSWLFGPAWTALYVLMGVAAFLVWRRGLAGREVRIALIVFLVQLILNAVWSPVFFGLQSPLSGLVIIAALWIAILLTIVRFWRISTAAGALLIPYIGWVSFATALNAAIWVLNP